MRAPWVRASRGANACRTGPSKGKNDFGQARLRRPGKPPPGSLTVNFFKLLALDTRLDLKAGTTKVQLQKPWAEVHILAEGKPYGDLRAKNKACTYSRGNPW